MAVETSQAKQHRQQYGEWNHIGLEEFMGFGHMQCQGIGNLQVVHINRHGVDV